MTDPHEEPVVYRDKRRLDPETGEVRTPPGDQQVPGAGGGPAGEDRPVQDERAAAADA